MKKFLSIFLLFLFTAAARGEDAFLQSEYSSSFSDKIRISGEAGGAFFDTEEEGEFPNEEFLIDEAKLFVEAEIVNHIYVFGEFNIVLREEPGENFELGELYVEFEDLLGKERLFNVRAGRFDIPFGEEYLTRDAIDNPLVTHSLIDIWGIDEGVELYGFTKYFDYIVAVQNGGEAIAHDYNSDKAIVGRITYKPTPALHFSVSAMRTGDLDVTNDKFSEAWFGNGFLRVLSSSVNTTAFGGTFYEADAYASWRYGHIHLAGGQLRYDDNDITADNSRNANYFQLEALQNLTSNKEYPWYAAARFSRITCNEGFPLVGNGDFGRFFFSNSQLAEELWRFSIGIGYRMSKHLLIKSEYNFENGKQINGTKRDRENFFGAEVAVRF
jgi:Putative beta-barrel porin-2, OmpL-like. bbp2